MKIVSHICDICKNSKYPKDLISFNFCQKDKEFAKYTLFGYSDPTFDICVDCLKEKGLEVKSREGLSDSDRYKQNRKTIEDKILDILVDLGVHFDE